MQNPEYPLLVRYTDGSENEVFDNEEELVNTLEWFDSEDPEFHANVIDNNGRLLKVVVVKLELRHMSFKDKLE